MEVTAKITAHHFVTVTKKSEAPVDPKTLLELLWPPKAPKAPPFGFCKRTNKTNVMDTKICITATKINISLFLVRLSQVINLFFSFWGVFTGFHSV